MQNKSCHFFFLCLRKLRCTKHYMTLCEQRLAFTTSAWYYYKALIWRSLIVVWIFHQPTVMSSQMSDQRRQGLTIYLCTWCIIRPRFIIASLSQCHRFARPPKFIISRWHWQETVFLHNILWSIAHMWTVTWLLSTLTICFPQYNSWAYSLLQLQITLTPSTI